MSEESNPLLSDATEERFRFTGSAGEYFGIWIVNLLLTLLTLGIYSAWAKVRKKRYFYGHTVLRGSSFEYLADPIAILKGRLIAVGVIVVYLAVTYVLPQTAVLFVIAFLIALPWLVARALAFNAHNSAYRNLRFNFQGAYGEAAWAFIGAALLVPLTFGLALPFFVQRQKRFVVNNAGYGQSRFSMEAGVGGFYVIYLKALAFLVVLGALWAAVAGGLMATLVAMRAADPGTVGTAGGAQIAGIAGFALAPIVFGLALLGVYAYVQARTANLVYGTSSVGECRLKCELGAAQLAWLYVTNAAGIVLTLGLLIPWASVRLARYRLQSMAALAEGGFDKFVARQQEAVAATGEELGEVLGVDIGL